ncbi:hypothetical protein BDZ97DRAFT_1654410 [Flammula alnicola]|nr:hypothetical protein BDZ97DRAFT_1654410 [Flammula alnicola]
MAELEQLLELLRINADTLNTLTFGSLFRFVTYAARLKDDILLPQPAHHSPLIAPELLPSSVLRFLASACGFSVAATEHCWSILKDIVWNSEDFAPEGTNFEACSRVFLAHGHTFGLLPRSIYPAQSHCINLDCQRTQKGLALKKTEQRQAVLYTLDNGPLPVWSVHLYCEKCNVNYHHNFYIHQGRRIYYGTGIPDVIQVGEHQFVERKVIELWTTLMVVSWTSATNCARFYNAALSGNRKPPPGWSFEFALDSDHVWNGFIILSLLEDLSPRKETLSVPHTGLDQDRYKAAMQSRNRCMRLYSQPEITHYCNKCTRFTTDGKRKVSIVVIDGVTVGHPCCSFHNCHTPLSSNRDRYCEDHRDAAGICAIVGCSTPVVLGTKTCTDEEHRAVEKIHIERGQSRFQLQERLARARVAHPNDSLGEEVTNISELADVDEDNEEFELATGQTTSSHADHTSGTAGLQKKKLRAQFGRKRTHNEQIIVAPCGMIMARETFFGAEAVSSVVEMIKRTYRVRGTMPDHIFFDNNCQLAKIVKDDPDFADVRLSVDVFHFKSKHKLTDKFCQENCNPAKFPELKGLGDKAWYFNSSIAEQTNVWLGGYHSMCREMLVDKYNFFLDEMILRCNRMTYSKLENALDMPNNWPSL